MVVFSFTDIACLRILDATLKEPPNWIGMDMMKSNIIPPCKPCIVYTKLHLQDLGVWANGAVLVEAVGFLQLRKEFSACNLELRGM